MQKEKRFNKYRINTKNNKFWKSSYLLSKEGKEGPPKVHRFRKDRERKLFIAKNETPRTISEEYQRRKVKRPSNSPQISQKEQK